MGSKVPTFVPTHLLGNGAMSTEDTAIDNSRGGSKGAASDAAAASDAQSPKGSTAAIGSVDVGEPIGPTASPVAAPRRASRTARPAVSTSLLSMRKTSAFSWGDEEETTPYPLPEVATEELLRTSGEEEASLAALMETVRRRKELKREELAMCEAEAERAALARAVCHAGEEEAMLQRRMRALLCFRRGWLLFSPSSIYVGQPGVDVGAPSH